MRTLRRAAKALEADARLEKATEALRGLMEFEPLHRIDSPSKAAWDVAHAFLSALSVEQEEGKDD